MRTMHGLRWILLVGLFAVSPGVIAASTAVADRHRAEEPAVFVDVSQLRSAYLHRAGRVHYDPGDGTPQGLRRQLQQHFDVVLRILIASTPTSIETALVRLETDRSESWTESERQEWRQRLLRSRLEQLVRLKAYRDRGVFPLNEGHSDDPVPIFVDRHDTACAVGHLMRLSGWDEVVQQVQMANNLVYVPDVDGGSLVEWTLESGLTQEEAALIQPGYGPGGPGGIVINPGGPVYLAPPANRDFTVWGSTFIGEYDAGDFEPGESYLEQNGLRFSNFRVETHRWGNRPDAIIPTVAEGLGLLTGTGYAAWPNESNPRYIAREHDPRGTHWLAIGVPKIEMDRDSPNQLLSRLHSLGGYALQDAAQRIVVRFDVSTVDASAHIDSFTQTSATMLHGFSDLYTEAYRNDFGLGPAKYSMTTRVFSGVDEIGTAYFDDSDVGIEVMPTLNDTVAFGAANHLTVETEIWLEDGAQLRTYLLDFNVVSVPEPSTLMLLVIGIGAGLIAGRRQIAVFRSRVLSGR